MKYILSVVAVLLVFAMAAPAADISGKWKAEMQTPNGTRESTFDFKVDGDKLTGTVTGARGSSEITEGKISGDDISFVVVRKFQEREIKQQYKGKVSGDQIKFDVTMGERNFEMVAKKI
ncbi:MAG TPA: hypothetical protein VN442_21490 [Bryobacteraceae bacterium]|nr:hypothetical protein [Bryobacteraceae bacterium]